MQNLTTNNGQTIHGALDYGELEHLGLSAEEILDFSVNVNPYGPSPLAREALTRAAIDQYPDRACLELRRAILEYELPTTSFSPNALVCGNGTTELIWAIARAELQPGRKTAILGPTFGEYRAACQAVGADIVEYRAPASRSFQPDVAEIISWLGQQQPALVWLCNPNNPTGTWLPRSALVQIAQTCQQICATLVVDEAYWHFVSPHEAFSAIELVETAAPLIVLRSLTKDFALAGLRLGYAVANAEIIVPRLSAQLPAWNVNGFAQKAGIAALQDQEYLTTTLAQLVFEGHAFFQALAEAKRQVLPSRTQFYLINVSDAAQVRRQLLRQRLLVRDCTSFGLPQFIRVATRPQADWQRLLQTLQEGL
jgi:histidinol-phosphate aminotransferase